MRIILLITCLVAAASSGSDSRSHQQSFLEAPSDYVPFCGSLEGTLKTFHYIEEFKEVIQNGQDYIFDFRGPCPGDQVVCPETYEPLCVSDGITRRTYHNGCFLAAEQYTPQKWNKVSSGACLAEIEVTTTITAEDSTPVPQKSSTVSITTIASESTTNPPEKATTRETLTTTKPFTTTPAPLPLLKLPSAPEISYRNNII